MWYALSILLLTTVCYMVPLIVFLPFHLSWLKKAGLFLVIMSNLIWMLFVVRNYGIFLLLVTVSLYLSCIDRHRLRNIGLFLFSYLLNVILNNIENTLLWLVTGIDISHMQAEPLFYICFIVASIAITYLMSKMLVFLWRKYASHINFSDVPKKTFIFIAVNLVLTVVLYAVNIIEGENIGYSAGVVSFNTLIFTAYFCITTWMIIHSIQMYKKEAEMKARQNAFLAMQKYTEQVENLYNNLRSFRHDYINILTTMYGYIDSKDMDGLEGYFHKHILPMKALLAPDNYQISRLANLKLVELKGLVTAKLIYAQEMGIKVTVEIDAPIERITGDVIDLARILGIFLDNAIEAALETEQPELSFAGIKTEGEIAFRISNHFIDRHLALSNLDKPDISTKGAGRGLGLYNVSQMIARNKNMYLETLIEKENFVQLLHVYDKAA